MEAVAINLREPADEFAPEQWEKIDAVIAAHRTKPGALIPVLEKVQGISGYLPEVIQRRVSRGLGIPLAQVYGVVTFYSFFTMIPKGKFPISICTGTACYVRGAENVLAEFKKQLDIQVGETSPDGSFSLSCLRCVGACGLAPVVQVGEKTYGRVAPDDVKGIIEEYSA